MWNLDYSRQKDIERLLEEKGFAMSKKFGQNFLLSSSAREKIVSLMGDIRGKAIFEIGPGFGSITSLMLKEGAFVRAFEIDHGFADILRNDAFKDEPGFSLVEGDALKTLFSEQCIPDLIAGNLPYNVGSVIIASIIENNFLPGRMVFTLQKEVCQRIAAKEKSGDYSSFSVLCQLDYEPRIAFSIPRSAFYPSPNVDSAVIVMERRKEKLIEDGERDAFFKLLRALFAQRRKTVRNNLKALHDNGTIGIILSKAGISEKERAENLSLQDILRLLRVSSDL